MGAFNTLIINSKCNQCKIETEIRIQFKYGDTWDYKYHIGDKIVWGGNSIGKEDAKKVVLDGTSEDCIQCGVSIDYLIFIENNTITSFEVNDGQFDFRPSDGYYLILE